jgi:hypothetical protein
MIPYGELDLTLLILLALWALLLFGGFVFGKAWSDGTRRMPRWTRLASSSVLVITAWYWFELGRREETIRSGLLIMRASNGVGYNYALLIAVGMTLGFIGDLFMAKLIVKSDKHVLGGIGAFGLGHIAYIAAFIGFGGYLARVPLVDPNGVASARLAAWLVWLIIGAAAWYVVVFRGQKHSVLHYAALPYALLLSSTAGVATELAINLSVFVPLAIGCALFLLSDLILAARLFNGLYFRLVDDVVWLTYGPAQMLIVYSVGVAMSLAR